MGGARGIPDFLEAGKLPSVPSGMLPEHGGRACGTPFLPMCSNYSGEPRTGEHLAIMVSQEIVSIAVGLLEQLHVVLKGKGKEGVLPSMIR